MAEKYKIKMISIEQIHVTNTRDRTEKSFQEVKGNISRVGLKKPVTVRPSDDGNGYDLVCGEGRLKSFIALGEKTVPAIVRHDISKDDAFVMSLVENMARRQHTAMDLLKGIELLKEQCYYVYLSMKGDVYGISEKNRVSSSCRSYLIRNFLRTASRPICSG